MELSWEAPPEEALLRARGGGGQYLEIAIALRKHPGKWAKLDREFPNAKTAQNAAANMRRGITKGFVKGEYDAVSHEKFVYVMFTGPLPEAEDAGEREDSVPPDPRRGSDPREGDRHRDREGPKIRAWARDQGYRVPERGRIPAEIRESYYANGDEPPVHYDEDDGA